MRRDGLAGPRLAAAAGDLPAAWPAWNDVPLPTGAGRRAMSRGPVFEAYADSDALSRKCPPPPAGCGAAIGDWCMQPTDIIRTQPIPRSIPCLARTRTEGDTP